MTARRPRSAARWSLEAYAPGFNPIDRLRRRLAGVAHGTLLSPEGFTRRLQRASLVGNPPVVGPPTVWLRAPSRGRRIGGRCHAGASGSATAEDCRKTPKFARLKTPKLAHSP
jgi:hypothetical protein